MATVKKRPAAKPAKKSATKKPAAKKSATNKPAAKKSAAKKSAANKSATNKSATKKSAAKKSATKKPAAAGMQLELESGKRIRNVTLEQLQQAIAGEEFAILGGGPKSNTYIQAAVQKESPYLYILEYQDGSLAEHYGAVHDGIELAEIVTAFSKYLQGDPSWRTDFTWERMKL